MNHEYTVNTYSFIQQYTAKQSLEALLDRGFKSFELMVYPGYLWPDDMSEADRSQFQRFLAEQDASVTSINIPNLDLNVASVTPGVREQSRQMLLKVIKLAGDLGIPNVMIGPGKVNPLNPEPTSVVKGYFFQALDEFVPAANKYGTRILVENMPQAFLPDCFSLAKTIEEYGSDDVGILYDAANAAFVAEDYKPSISECLSRLEQVHVSDTRSDVYQHAPVGDGEMDFKSLGKALQDIGWSKQPILEIVSNSKDPIMGIEQSIDKLDALGWRFGSERGE